jgi:hypothetical protein
MLTNWIKPYKIDLKMLRSQKMFVFLTHKLLGKAKEKSLCKTKSTSSQYSKEIVSLKTGKPKKESELKSGNQNTKIWRRNVRTE